MNALRHGLAAKNTATIDDHAPPDGSFADAMYLRLRRIEVERVKVLNDFYSRSGSQDVDKLQTVLRLLAALERYSQRSHSKLKKHISCGGTFQRKQ